ncbi:ribose-phosphate pyrophosphokinase-like domain-containing protein [Nocardia vaccinii]
MRRTGSEPVAEHLLELPLILDACRCSSARRITAVVLSSGYAR